MTSIVYDFERVQERMFEALDEVQYKRNMDTTTFLREVRDWFGYDVADPYEDWLMEGED